MAGKRGTKERHRAQEAQAASAASWQKFLDEIQGSKALQAGEQTQMSLMDMIPGLLSGETPMPYGLSAPNVMENLLARSRESSAQQMSRSAQEMGNLMPTRGGAAARGIADVFSRGSSAQAATETGLRAQAAQDELGNRMSLLSGILGGIGGAGQVGMGKMGLLGQGYGGLAGAHGNAADMFNQQYMQKQQQHYGMMGGIGQGLMGMGGSILGAVLAPFTGGLSLALPMLGGMGGMMGGGGMQGGGVLPQSQRMPGMGGLSFSRGAFGR